METHSQPASDMGYTPTPAPTPNTTTTAHGKKGVVDKVKELMAGHGHKTDTTAGAQHHQQQTPVYGDATTTAGNAESTRVGCLDKIKAKAGVGHGHAPEQARAAHQQGYADPSASPDFNGGTNVNSSAAVHGGWPHPTNPHQRQGNPNQAMPGGYGDQHPTNPMGNPDQAMAGGYGDPHPTNPTGVTNSQGGAVLGDHHGNVHEGPRDDDVKKEGFMSKIMDKLHSPKGNPNQAMAGGYGDPHPTNSNQVMAGGYGDPHPTNPTGVTNSQGGAVLGDHHGNVHEGPRDDDVKKEGFMSKVMDKLHSPKGKPAQTTTPTSY